jgi:hypothetical protein
LGRTDLADTAGQVGPVARAEGPRAPTEGPSASQDSLATAAATHAAQLPIRELHSAGRARPRWYVLPRDYLVLRRRHDSLTETTTLPFARPAST